jgi:GTP cyclohydrolase I|tara:strand:+ start:134 stop:778 length:645 start_codon:yes stop_codon:yes gene_type:complete
MTKKVSKDEALKAVKNVNDKTSEGSLQAEAMEAVKTLILWAGDNPEREGLLDTPKRVVKAYKQFFSGYNDDPEEILSRTFEEVDGYDDAVIVRDIRLESHCEHHMVPIIGVAHVGYIPSSRVVGISKLARLVDCYSKRLQTQETMTAQIANTIDKVLKPKGVAVVIDSNHNCMSTRGVHKTHSSTITSRMLGIFRTDNKAREEFINLINSPQKF